jgi:ferritin
MQKAINDQVQAELYSSYLYRQMMLWCAQNNLKGFAHWLFVQTYEEDFHAAKLYNFLVDRGGSAELQAVDGPPAEFSSLIDIFGRTLGHEQMVTARIHSLYETALEEKDYAAQSFLKWYIDEQVEEEASASEVLEKLKMAENRQGLLLLDAEMSARAPGVELTAYLAALSPRAAAA